MSKYDQLGERLVAQDSPQVKMTFETVDGLVGGLPPSARTQRTWWANNSHGHALVWRAAGWHVSAVDLAGREVTFARGRAGGSHADRATQGSAGPSTTRKAHQSQAPLAMTPGQVVAETVTFTWHDVGPVTLDGAGKLTFPGPLPRQPGVYRLTLLADGKRSRVYIGESDSVLRRLSTNYRNPGSTQQTSLRVNAELREHLATGGTVHLELTLEAFVSPKAEHQPRWTCAAKRPACSWRTLHWSGPTPTQRQTWSTSDNPAWETPSRANPSPGACMRPADARDPLFPCGRRSNSGRQRAPASVTCPPCPTSR